MRKKRLGRPRPHIPRSPVRRLGQVLVVALFAVAFYYWGAKRIGNQAVAETPSVQMTVAQEHALDRQAAPLMIQQHGGLYADKQARALVQRIGERLVARSIGDPAAYSFAFHVLADEHHLNVFALPGGSIFMTAALVTRCRTEGELAALLAHALAHIVERHAAVQLEAAHPEAAVPSAAAFDAFDPDAPADAESMRITSFILQAVALSYSPNDERAADVRSVGLLAEAGYNPETLIRAMKRVRDAAPEERSGFFDSHPNPFRRFEQIQQAIDTLFPDGVPEGLIE